MNISDFRKIQSKIPKNPGVYFFKKNNKILYIGRATSLQSRIKSYFDKDIIETRGQLILSMIFNANKISFRKTDSVLEAVLLEAELIKKHKPYYNTKEKDDKSFNLLTISKERFPKVSIIRSKEFLKKDPKDFSNVFGPFTSSILLKQSLKILRKIFPFRDKCTPFEELKNKNNIKPCFYHSIGLCPGVCVGKISSTEYKKNITRLVMFMKGKKDSLLLDLSKEMKSLSKRLEFEKASQIRDTIESLKHLRESALIFTEESEKAKVVNEDQLRIEAFDIAHFAGDSAIGVMVVDVSGSLNKELYRTFNIKNDNKLNDLSSLKEILERRLNHKEWDYPSVLVVDGGLNHLKIAKDIVKRYDEKINVISVVKDKNHKARAILGGLENKKLKERIIKINAEAHRFSIQKHRGSLRKKLLI